MTQGRDNWVCFKCRYAVRVLKASGHAPLCPSCGNVCACVGHKLPIPAKDNVKEWKSLENDYAAMTMAAAESIEAQKKLLIRQIEKLSAMEQNKDRERLIKELRQKLDLL